VADNSKVRLETEKWVSECKQRLARGRDGQLRLLSPGATTLEVAVKKVQNKLDRWRQLLGSFCVSPEGDPAGAEPCSKWQARVATGEPRTKRRQATSHSVQR